MKPAAIQIVRGFVDIAEGQVHYRQAGSSPPGQPPLVMFHASPGSAKSLEPLMQVLASRRRVIALDTLGNGDSCAPHPENPDLEKCLTIKLMLLDTMLDKVDSSTLHLHNIVQENIENQNEIEDAQMVLGNNMVPFLTGLSLEDA